MYELGLTNFSSGPITVRRVQVLDGRGRALLTYGPAAVAGRLQPGGERTATATMKGSTQALLFVHVTLPAGAPVPRTLRHRITSVVAAAPPGRRTRTEVGGATPVDRQPVATIGPPLAGGGYVSADSCCDATRHTRAALPVDGRVRVAQRMAVDWEQLAAAGRIYDGPRERLTSYTIFGKPVLAVADARVVSTIDGEPEQVPGKFPAGITLAQADGNAVVLDLGRSRYALYAHMQPGSIRVKAGDRVRRGQVIGQVGNTGNSIAPHLHFHVMDGPSPLASDGLPYEIDSYQVTGRGAGTAAFDRAEADGTPMPVAPVLPPTPVTDALPLDQLIIAFPG